VRQILLCYKLLKTETRYVEQGGHAYKCEPSPEQQQNWQSVFEPRWGKNVISLRPWAGTRHKQRSIPEAGQEHMERKRGRMYQRREKGQKDREERNNEGKNVGQTEKIRNELLASGCGQISGVATNTQPASGALKREERKAARLPVCPSVSLRNSMSAL